MTPQYDNNEPDDDIREPNLIVLGINYTKAIARWIAEGRPVRDVEEVTRIFNEICSSCPYFNDVRQTCKICGCRARRSGNALMNKIAMKTESCPKRKW
ncbi:MAG: hypothetical protein FWD31_05005 [Planctomycetaceae bacterium]|nr:hypothetical protein [Planctomycetaceae bacterium]